MEAQTLRLGGIPEVCSSLSPRISQISNLPHANKPAILRLSTLLDRSGITKYLSNIAIPSTMPGIFEAQMESAWPL